MDKLRFGLDALDNARLAELKSILQVELYSHNSMDGPWYSSVDLASAVAAIRAAVDAGDRATAERLANNEEKALPYVEIQLNVGEHFGLPKHPMGGTWILELQTTGPEQSQAFEQALQRSALLARRLT